MFTYSFNTNLTLIRMGALSMEGMRSRMPEFLDKVYFVKTSQGSRKFIMTKEIPVQACVGLVGQGPLGRRVFRNLRTWYPFVKVVVWDPQFRNVMPALMLGAMYASSPRDLAATSTVIISCIPNENELLHVLFGYGIYYNIGILNGIQEGTLYLELTSVQPDFRNVTRTAILAKRARYYNFPIER